MPATLIDLRRAGAPPLPGPGLKIRLTWEQIEDGTHGLSADQGPFLVVCDQGSRASLAARFLRADGLDAQALTPQL